MCALSAYESMFTVRTMFINKDDGMSIDINASVDIAFLVFQLIVVGLYSPCQGPVSSCVDTTIHIFKCTCCRGMSFQPFPPSLPGGFAFQIKLIGFRYGLGIEA